MERFGHQLIADELPDLMDRFFSLLDSSTWDRAFARLAKRLAEGPFGHEYAARRLPIELELYRIRQNNAAAGKYVVEAVTPARLSAYQFLWSFVQVFERTTAIGQVRMRGDLRSALDIGFQPLAFELATVVHLSTFGFDIELLDIEGGGRFDYLIAKDGKTFELDCKSISTDVGRRIHAEQFHRLAIKAQRRLGEHLPPGGHIVRLTIPGRLVVTDDVRGSFAEMIENAIDSEESTAIDGLGTASYQRFNRDELQLGRTSRDPLTRSALQELGIQPDRTFVLKNSIGTVIVAVRSELPDRSQDRLYEQLKRSAESQFSRTRPAILAVELRDLDADQIRDMATRRGSWLPQVAGRLLAATSRHHVIGLGFMAAASELSDVGSSGSSDSSLQNRGTVWLFNNAQHERSMETLFSMYPSAQQRGVAG